MSLFARWKAAPRSWWHETAGDRPLNEIAAAPARVPYVIVGAGITGAACAYELARHGVPAKDILIIDAGSTAFGASGRNGGFVLTFPGPELLEWHHYGGEAFRRLVAENIRNRDLVLRTADELEVPVQRGGSWYGAPTVEEAELIRRCHALLVDDGHSSYELHPTVPGPAAGHFHTAIFQPNDAGIHPAAYARALASASGAMVLPDCEVEKNSDQSSGGGLRLQTTRGPIESEHVIFAVNAAAHWLLPDAVARHIRPVRNQVWLLEVEGETGNRLWGDAVYYSDFGYDYWRQFPDGRILIGGARKPVAASEEDTSELEANAGVQEYLETTLLPLLTAGRPAKILRHWQGIMGFSPDTLPFIADVPDADGRAVFAGGFTGYGLGFHRVVAEALVSKLLKGTDAGIWDARRLAKPPAAVR